MLSKQQTKEVSGACYTNCDQIYWIIYKKSERSSIDIISKSKSTRMLWMKVLVNAKNICYRILQIGLDILHPCVGNHELPSKIVDMALSSMRIQVLSKICHTCYSTWVSIVVPQIAPEDSQTIDVCREVQTLKISKILLSALTAT